MTERNPTLLHQELSAIYKNIPGIVFYIAVEPEGEFRFVSVSREFLLATGLSREQVVGSLVRDILPPSSRDMVLNHYREAILSGRTVRWEEESVYPAGLKRGEVSVTPLYDGGAVATHLIGIVHDITERKSMEESRRENEERQAFLLRLSDALRPLGDPLDTQEVAARLLGEHLRVNRVGYAEVDASGYVIRREYARGVRPLAGQGPAGTFGAALRDAYKNGETVVVNDVDTDPRFTEAERAIMQARQIAAYVGVTLIKDGQLVAAFGANNAIPRVWTSIEVELIRDVAERTWQAVERTRAEAAVREREQRLRLALEASGAGSWMRDLRIDRVDWDGRFREIYGITAAEPASFEAWLGRLHEEDRGRVLELWDGILHKKTSDTFDCTFRIVRPDGTMSWIQSLGQADRDANGQLIRLTGIDLDITARKGLEESLRESEERLRLAMTSGNIGFWDWNVGSGQAAWSSELENIHGLDHAGSYEAFSSRVHPDDLAGVESERDAAIRDHKPFYLEFRIILPSGEIRWLSARGKGYYDENGRVVRVVGSNIDITERKRIEEERAVELRRKNEFLSLLGHELRNPLAAISTAVQLLSGSASDDERASLNGMMDRQVKLMQRLLDDLIDLGRITHGHIQLKKGPINLARFLQHVTKVTQSITAQRGQEMILRLPSEVVTFKADEARLEQIATNLLNNASKYTPRGGRIEFSGAREGLEVVIRCKDNGRGIPREMHQTIFQPFTRVEPLSNSRGEASLGIGLALVKKLVELHGGTISVESGGSGTGSEFVVRLPLESAPSDLPAAPEARRATGLSRPIVLIEDNSDVAGTMVIALEKAGYRATLFADAFSALAGISDLKPHAIVLDIGLPGMDGYELAAKLREQPDLQNTLFIGLSGFKRREAAESANNFDHFFNKPVDLPALLSLLDISTSKGRSASGSSHRGSR